MIRALHTLFKEWTTEVEYRDDYPEGGIPTLFLYIGDFKSGLRLVALVSIKSRHQFNCALGVFKGKKPLELKYKQPITGYFELQDILEDLSKLEA